MCNRFFETVFTYELKRILEGLMRLKITKEASTQKSASLIVSVCKNQSNYELPIKHKAVL